MTYIDTPDDYLIAVGDRFPSYRALCRKLGVPIKTGDAKRIQVEYWQNCFLWERNKNAYIITKVIKPLDKRPHMQREGSKWYKSASVILLNKIVDSISQGVDSENYNKAIFTSPEAYLALGLCNGRFNTLKSKSISDIPIEHGILLYRHAYNKFYHILHNVLDSLVNQSIITHAKTYRFSRKDEGNKIRLATHEELKIILAIIYDLLQKFELQHEYHVILLHKDVEFYEELNILLEEKGFNNCYKVHRIGFTEHELPKYNGYADSLEAQTSAKLDINSKSCSDLFSESEAIADGAHDSFEEYLEVSKNINRLINLTIPTID